MTQSDLLLIVHEMLDTLMQHGREPAMIFLGPDARHAFRQFMSSSLHVTILPGDPDYGKMTIEGHEWKAMTIHGVLMVSRPMGGGHH